MTQPEAVSLKTACLPSLYLSWMLSFADLRFCFFLSKYLMPQNKEIISARELLIYKTILKLYIVYSRVHYVIILERMMTANVIINAVILTL